MLYYYWSRKGIRPSVIHNLPPGEYTLIRAFYEYEHEEREKVYASGKVWPFIPVM
ncbi:hypothetical protein [Paenibacillus tyrfis]|uniref:hypothetical protein n=1 Tax=Paenibacillus tyrfis TaxID=1501230 RepID=UPI000ADFB8F4|nr:hypothetical protein [Paenibacillus tyrfis]